MAVMRVLRDTCRRERRERPIAASLAVTGVGGLLAGAALVAGGLVILAQLVAGLALVPLTMATYLRLLPAAPWTDGRNDGGPGWGRTTAARGSPVAPTPERTGIASSDSSATTSRTASSFPPDVLLFRASAWSLRARHTRLRVGSRSCGKACGTARRGHVAPPSARGKHRSGLG